MTRDKLSALNIPHRAECSEHCCYCTPDDAVPFATCDGCGIAAAPIDDSGCPLCELRTRETIARRGDI